MAPFASSGTLAISNQMPEIDDEGVPHLDNDCNQDHDKCHGRLWIFYSDVNRISRWGTINDYKFGHVASLIACRQLGYTTSVPKDTDDPTPPDLINGENITIWLTDFAECKNDADVEKYNNLLQCKPSLCNDTVCNPKSDHVRDVIIKCENGECYSYRLMQ